VIEYVDNDPIDSQRADRPRPSSPHDLPEPSEVTLMGRAIESRVQVVDSLSPCHTIDLIPRRPPGLAGFFLSQMGVSHG